MTKVYTNSPSSLKYHNARTNGGDSHPPPAKIPNYGSAFNDDDDDDRSNSGDDDDGDDDNSDK